MALKTWKFRLGDKEISVKAKKDLAETFGVQLRQIYRVPQIVRELTGVIGCTEGSNKEHSWTMQSLGGPSGTPLTDPEGYKREIAEFVEAVPTSFTEGPEMESWAKTASELITKHTPVKDNRKTPEQYEEQQRQFKAMDEERETARKEKESKENAEAANLIRLYPQLTSLKSSGGKSRWANGAANIRIEIAKAFPGVLFTVRTSTGSMTDSIDIRWTDGPTAKEVQAITGKYQTASFDGMQDLESSVATVFNRVFGGSKYISEQREVSVEHQIAVAKEMGYDLTAENFSQYGSLKADALGGSGDSHELIQDIQHKAHETPRMPDVSQIAAPAQENQEAGTEGITVSLNAERAGVELHFPGKPEREVIDRVKAMGFRWSPRQKLWYAKQSDSRIRFAYALAGTQIPETTGVDSLTEEQDREGAEFCPSEQEVGV